MGGFMKGAITGKNADGSPISTGQGIMGGFMKGSALGMGSGLGGPNGPEGQGGGGILQPGPGPAPVDPSYFRPQDFGVNPINSAIYGR